MRWQRTRKGGVDARRVEVAGTWVMYAGRGTVEVPTTDASQGLCIVIDTKNHKNSNVRWTRQNSLFFIELLETHYCLNNYSLCILN